MTHNKRIATLRVLVGSHYSLVNSRKRNNIVGELNRIVATNKLPKGNGALLAVLHTTRVLDTTLSEILAYKRWQTRGSAIGDYLIALRNSGCLTEAQREGFQKSIVKKRNTYMHEAGAMPSKLEADKILNEMHTCMSAVINNLGPK
jgi:hypothetical protein